jgi:hypothetical protein
MKHEQHALTAYEPPLCRGTRAASGPLPGSGFCNSRRSPIGCSQFATMSQFAKMREQ